MKFQLGRLLATLGALKAMKMAGNDLAVFMARHLRGDWDDVDRHDTRENEYSLLHAYDS